MSSINSATLREFIALAIEIQIEQRLPLVAALDIAADVYPTLEIADAYNVILENDIMTTATAANPFAAHFAARDAQIKAAIDQTCSEIRACRDAGDTRSVRDLSRKLRQLRRASSNR